MSFATPSSASPFDPISGDLLPDYRDAYVQGHLSPELAQTIEDYLKNSPIQTNIVLGRAHALAAAAQAEGHTFAPPAWVQQQLQFQPTVSKAGPLRRPVVRLALGLFAAFILASVVQWLRNEPLVPAPVARVVVQAARSASQAVQRLVAPAAPAPAEAPAVAAKAPAPRPRPQATRPATLAPTPAMPARVVTVAAPLADSTAAAPAAITTAPAGAPTTVHGRITDDQGRPLPGATVLVKGTRQVISTNASGDYELAVPAGSTLLFGYGGYIDQAQPAPSAGSLNVVLLPSAPARSRR